MLIHLSKAYLVLLKRAKRAGLDGMGNSPMQHDSITDDYQKTEHASDVETFYLTLDNRRI